MINLGTYWVTFLASAIIWPLRAQTGNPGGQRLLNEGELDAVGSLVYSLPPHLSPSFLVQLARLTGDRDRKERFLTDAFRLASHAQPFDFNYVSAPLAFPHKRAMGGDRAGTEGMTVQLDAVEEFSISNPTAALTLLETIIPVIPRKYDCGDDLLPNVRKQYSRILELAKKLFPNTSNGRRRRHQYFTRLFAHVESSLQLPSLIRFASDPEFSEDDARALIAVLTVAFDQIKGGDPEFTAAAVFDELSRSVLSLLTSMTRHRIDSSTLLNAYRSFLVRSNTRRCSDLVAYDRTVLRVPRWNPFNTFNSVIASEAAFSGRLQQRPKPLSDDEMRPGIVVTKQTHDLVILDSPDAKALSSELLQFFERRSASTANDDLKDQRLREIEEYMPRFIRYVRGLPNDNQSPLQAVLEVRYFHDRLLELDSSLAHQERVAESYIHELARLWPSSEVKEIAVVYVRKVLTSCWLDVEKERDGAAKKARWEGALRGAAGGDPTFTTLINLIIKLSPRSATCK